MPQTLITVSVSQTTEVYVQQTSISSPYLTHSRHVKENTKLIAVYDCDTMIATVYYAITALPYAHK